ncbi:MAG: hypothetical protein GTN81_14850 [Proteobacteria bacterium]|nr:hypothetical protein [Pseudomonadota bacterium]
MISILIALYPAGAANSVHVSKARESSIEPLIGKTTAMKEKPRRGQENLRFVLTILMTLPESSPHERSEPDREKMTQQDVNKWY